MKVLQESCHQFPGKRLLHQPFHAPTPTDAIEIVSFSGGGQSDEAYILVYFCGNWEGCEGRGPGLLIEDYFHY